MVAGQAVIAACRNLRTALREAAAALTGAGPHQCTLTPHGVLCGTRLVEFGELPPGLTGRGRHDGTPRSVAFNVQGFRVAVNPETGEVADPAVGAELPTRAW